MQTCKIFRLTSILSFILLNGISAQDVIWTGLVNSDWSEDGNWDGNIAPTNGDAVVLTNGVHPPVNQDISGLSLSKLTFDSGATSAITLSGMQLELSGAQGIEIAATSADHTIALNLMLTVSQAWTVGAGRSLNVNGTISSNSGLTLEKLGTGTLDLSGGGNNSFQNTLKISKGTVLFSSAGQLGDATNKIELRDAGAEGGSLKLKSGSGNVVLNQVLDSFTGGVTAVKLDITGNDILGITHFLENTATDRHRYVKSGNGTFSYLPATVNTGINTWSMQMEGGTVKVNQLPYRDQGTNGGTTGFLEFFQDSIYEVLMHPSSLPTSNFNFAYGFQTVKLNPDVTATIRIASGATFKNNGRTNANQVLVSSGSTLHIEGADNTAKFEWGTSSSGGILSTTDNSGTVNLRGGRLSFFFSSKNPTWPNQTNFTQKINGGYWEGKPDGYLSGALNINGHLFINDEEDTNGDLWGTPQINHLEIGGSGNTFWNHTVQKIGSSTFEIKRNSGSSTTVKSGAQIQIVNGTFAVGGTVDPLTDSTDSSRHLNVDVSGASGIFKVTEGTKTVGKLELTGTAEVSNGAILRVSNSETLVNKSGQATVTGTLSGTGLLNGSVAVQAGGRLIPGNGIGTLTTGSVTFNTASTLEIKCQTPGTSSLLAIQGDLILDGTLDLKNQGGFALGVYTIATFTGNLTDLGMELGTVPYGGYNYQILPRTSHKDVLLLVTDSTPPSVQINQASGQADPATIEPVLFEVVFNEPIQNFTAAALQLGGITGASSIEIVETGPLDKTTYLVAVSGMFRDGILSVTIPANRVKDFSNFWNFASTSTDNAVTYDAPSPVVSNINPSFGVTAGGTEVTLSGTAFLGTTSVKFDGQPATIIFNTATVLKVLTPVHAAGMVDLEIITGGGSQTLSLAYAYNDPPVVGPLILNPDDPELGVLVTASLSASDPNNDPLTIVYDWGDGTVGAAHTHVYTTPGSYTVTATVQDGFYEVLVGKNLLAGHSVDLIEPAVGLSEGGQEIVLTGRKLHNIASVTFNGLPATILSNISTQIVVRSPAHPSGAVAVATTKNGGTQNLPNAFVYNDPPVFGSDLIVSNSGPKVNTPIMIDPNVIDPDEDTLTIIYDWGDGTIDSGPSHTYSVPGTYTVTITVSDGKYTTSTTLQIVVKVPALVSKFSGSANFTKSGQDQVRLQGTLPNLKPGLQLAGQELIFNVGGAELVFLLDRKGRAKNEKSSVALRVRFVRNASTGFQEFAGGHIPYTAKLRGDFIAHWQNNGLDLLTDNKNAVMNFLVDVTFGGLTYTDSTLTRVSVKAVRMARFRK